MTRQIDTLLRRLDALVERALALPPTEDSWEQRLYLDFELLLLFRQIAALSAGPRPYWMIPDLGLAPGTDTGPDDADPTFKLR